MLPPKIPILPFRAKPAAYVPKVSVIAPVIVKDERLLMT